MTNPAADADPPSSGNIYMTRQDTWRVALGLTAFTIAAALAVMLALVVPYG